MGGSFQTFDTKEWKGLNEDENPTALRMGELAIAENVWRYGHLIGTRPGTQYEGTDGDWDETVDAGEGVEDPCQGLHDCSNAFDATRKLVAIFGGDIYDAHDNVIGKAGAAPATVTAGADNMWTFAMHAGNVYAAGGATAAPDTVWYWDLAAGNVEAVTFEESTGVGQIFAGYIFEKWNRLWINGLTGTAASNNPMVGRYSALNDGTSWSPANTIGGSSAVGGFSSYGDEFSTGWGSYHDNQTGDFLLFLTNKNIYSIVQEGNVYTPFSTNDVIPTGCVSQRAFVDLGVDAGDAVYLSEKGVHSLRQSQIHGPRSDRFLSWPIRNTFATLNRSRLKYATGAYLHEHGLVIFAVPTGSNTYNDLILALDVRDADTKEGLTSESAIWYIWRLASSDAMHFPQVLVPARDRSSSETPYVYGGNLKGDVFRFTTANFSDMGAAYATHLRTRHDDFGVPMVTKIPGNGEVWVEPTDDYSITMNLVFDNGRRTSSARTLDLVSHGLTLSFVLDDTAILGSESNLQRKVFFGTGHGETIAHDFHHSGANQPFWIARISQQVAGLGDELGDVAA